MGAARQGFGGIVCSPLERRRVLDLFEVDFACGGNERGPNDGKKDGVE